MWKVVVRIVAFTVPVSITFFDVCGYVAKVEGFSMQPALNPKNWKISDYVLLNRWSARQFHFQRGEIVCLTCPSNPDQTIIKRIIALEGDTVRTLGYRNLFVTIPRGHCWVEGDHHSLSMDSNMFGPVAIGLIYAKASRIVWPPQRWQRLQPIDVQSRLSRRYSSSNLAAAAEAAAAANDDDEKFQSSTNSDERTKDKDILALDR